jgi:SAM-dependent methyltransferase
MGSLSSIETGTVDLIFSQAVLEHVRKHEFLDTMRECSRVLIPEGVASHRVDLKDHLGGSLNNLRFSERVWESEFFVRSGFYTNRIRFSEMIALFEDAELIVEICEVRRWEHLPVKRSSLSKSFLCFSDEDLTVSGFDVLLRKHI